MALVQIWRLMSTLLVISLLRSTPMVVPVQPQNRRLIRRLKRRGIVERQLLSTKLPLPNTLTPRHTMPLPSIKIIILSLTSRPIITVTNMRKL